MLGIILAVVAGISMSFQGVFNTRLGEKIGPWHTNVFVQGTGFIIALIVLLAMRNGSYSGLKDVNKLYLLGGLLGVVITFTVMEAMKRCGVTCAVSTILIAQLTAAGLIDAFGLFNTTVIKFDITKILGVIVMIAGIIIFKCKG